LLFATLVSTNISAASFDCNKARSLVEQTICFNPEVSSLDDQLATSYKEVLKATKDKNSVKALQRAWLALRNKCEDIDCLKEAYKNRISQLSQTTGNARTGNITKSHFTALDAYGKPTTPSSGPNPHSCAKDNNTGLVWEIKTADGGLHDQKWIYTWGPYNARDARCFAMGRCNTDMFVKDVNAAGWCGFHDWRMPTKDELMTIYNKIPNKRASWAPPTLAVDRVYFPNTEEYEYWTATECGRDCANIIFNGGVGSYVASGISFAVRLVRCCGEAPSVDVRP
jgi:uncharacterized protein